MTKAMRMAWVAVAAVAVFVFGSRCRSAEPIPLKVLYAGDTKNDRTADFRSFLQQQFATVGVADYLSLRQAETAGYDVIILDWPDLPPRENGVFKHPALDRDYNRPTILIGGGSLGVGRSQQLKLDDLCLCLADAAHGIATTHEVFHKPYEIRLAFEDRPVPVYYRNWPIGEPLGETMKVWKVQKRGWSAENTESNPFMAGMVSDPCGFTDSPDCEFIASGINMKSPQAVAIGRQGNFLLWGFYAPPSDLMPEARNCLVNAICYIKKFDSQMPLVRKTRRGIASARLRALVYAADFKTILDREWFIGTQPASLRNDSEKIAELHRERVQQYRDLFPDELRQAFGNDAERYIKFYRDNLEFLHPSEGPGFPLCVDQDVKGLGLSNRKVELLDRCVGMLEHGDQPDRAIRILKRYTTEHFADAKRWRTWIQAHQDRLYFTDVGGFKFRVAPESMYGASSMAAGPSERDSEHPVASQAELSPPIFDAGGIVDFVVRVNMAPTWHIYATKRSNGPGFATALKLKLPKGVETDGEWICPESSRGFDGQMVYEGTFDFRRKLRVDRDAGPGPIRVACEFSYQACTQRSCQPPTKDDLQANGMINGRSLSGR